MARGGRNIPPLKEVWALKGALLLKLYKGKPVVQHWPKAYGPPRSQAQADTITAFKQIQRAMKTARPEYWVDAINSTSKTGMYPRDYMFQLFTGTNFIPEYTMGGAISAAVDMIADFTMTNGQTVAVINNIPPGYKKLSIEMLCRGLTSALNVDGNLRFNNDSGAHYDAHVWDAGGQGVQTAGTSMNQFRAAGATAQANVFAINHIEIPYYSESVAWKTCRGYDEAFFTLSPQNALISFWNGLWRSAAAITRIDLTLPGGFVAGSRITAYGWY